MNKNQHIPITRLRSLPVGSTVSLPNVTPRSLYLGRFTADGYAELWSSKESMDGGNMWRTLATGSHPVESVQ